MKTRLVLALLLSIPVMQRPCVAHVQVSDPAAQSVTFRSTISGKIWDDETDNYVYDESVDLALADVMVYLDRPNPGRTVQIAKSKTDARGEYRFNELEVDPGTYVMRVDSLTLPLRPERYRQGESGFRRPIELRGPTDYELNFFFVQADASDLDGSDVKLSGRAWTDVAGSRLPLAGVVVQLKSERDDDIVATAMTDSNGEYAFPSDSLKRDVSYLVSMVEWPEPDSGDTPYPIPIRLSDGDPLRVANFGFVSDARFPPDPIFVPGAQRVEGLRLKKDDGGVTGRPGQTLTYLLSYENLGNTAATGVLLSDTVPENTRFDKDASTDGWDCADNSSAGTVCNINVGTVEARRRYPTERFAVTIDDPLPDGVTEIYNKASVYDDGGQGDEDFDATPVSSQCSDACCACRLGVNDILAPIWSLFLVLMAGASGNGLFALLALLALLAFLAWKIIRRLLPKGTPDTPPSTPPKPAVPTNWIALFLKYRDEKNWPKMYELAALMPPLLRSSPLVRQQLGFALNRDGRDEEAELVLRELLEEEGPSPETLGILGRVYKDRWYNARNAGLTDQATGHLEKALETYLAGHEADKKNPYPGVNALTLMEFVDPPPDGLKELLEEVTAAAKKGNQENRYWDHATRLELAVLASDEAGARAALGDAIAAHRVDWEIETTLNNLSLIGLGRNERGRSVPGWVADVEATLQSVMAGS